ncbi:MAG: CBS domain-containing protein [Elusimicrobia bacterium]|nr:CBS domain-containing protein [Elusimicrobiota bacterium]
MGYTAKVLMKDVVCVSPEATVTKAAEVMKKSNIGSVFVGDAAEPLGIFTERDIARRVVAEKLDPRKTAVSKVMTKKLVTVESSESLEKVFECLGKGEFRHLPITEGGKVVGIVSLTDLSRVLKEMYQDEKFLETFVGGAAAGAEGPAPH